MKAKDFDKKFDEGKEDILEYFVPSKKLRKHAQEKGYNILEKETKELKLSSPLAKFMYCATGPSPCVG